MEPFGDRRDLKPFESRTYDRRLVVFSEEEMLDAIRAAGAATGKGQFVSLQDFVLWRKVEQERPFRDER